MRSSSSRPSPSCWPKTQGGFHLSRCPDSWVHFSPPVGVP
jgi:hypothetical protein